jgi:hypothetical protein
VTAKIEEDAEEGDATVTAILKKDPDDESMADAATDDGNDTVV